MTQLTYLESIQQFRADRDRRMTTNPRNWLSLCGLFWLEQGDNPFGSAVGNKIILPQLPQEQCGNLQRIDGNIYLLDAAEGITVNGTETPTRALRNDHDENPDLIECGSVVMMVILRGEHLLLRAWDTSALSLKEFNGLHYYPVKPEFRLTARYVAYDPPKIEKTYDIIGTPYDSEFSGRAIFTLGGVEYSLDAQADEDELLFSFVDETRHDSTYPGGRYLVAPKPENGLVTLDFNQACNWPCAYTTFATCPVPPAQNRLGVRIEAGELRYH